MYRHRFYLATATLAVLFGFLAPPLAAAGGPAWLAYDGLGWVVLRALVATPVAVVLALLFHHMTRRDR